MALRFCLGRPFPSIRSSAASTLNFFERCLTGHPMTDEIAANNGTRPAYPTPAVHVNYISCGGRLVYCIQKLIHGGRSRDAKISDGYPAMQHRMLSNILKQMRVGPQLSLLGQIQKEGDTGCQQALQLGPGFCIIQRTGILTRK